MNRHTPPHIFTLICTAGVGGVSMTMFLPSLPSMSNFFSTPSSIMQLSVSVYLAASAILQLIIGPLSDRYGRRPVMLTCFVIYLVGTIVCFLSTQVEFLILGRIIQSAAVAGQVLSRAIVRDLHEPKHAASMIGYVTMGLALGPMVAPAIGGIFDDLYGWQANFICMFFLGVFVLFIVYVNLGETNLGESNSLQKQFLQYPVLLKSRRFWGYTLTASFSVGTFFAFLGGAPFLATNSFHLSSIEYGFYFMIISAGYVMGNFISGKFSATVGINKMIISGTIIATLGISIGIGLIGSGVQHPLAMFGPIIFLGIGNGVTLPSANAGLVSVRPEISGTASGLGGCLQIGGGAVLSAVAGILVTSFNAPATLLVFMAGCSVLSILTAIYVIYIDRLNKA